eukprot:SAG11_NODE_21951_length_415_cov_0.968354_1_plen_78_part_01
MLLTGCCTRADFSETSREVTERRDFPHTANPLTTVTVNLKNAGDDGGGGGMTSDTTALLFMVPPDAGKRGRPLQSLRR